MNENSTEVNSLFHRLKTEFSFIKGNFLVLVFSWIIMDLASELPQTYYGLYVKALGGSASIIGLIGSAFMLSQAFVQIPGGYIADKYGRKWIISIMTFGIAISQAIFALAPSWEWIMIGTIFQGFCFIYRPALMAIIADSLPQEKRGMGFSIINLISSVSTTPSPLVAGWLLQLYGLVPSMRIGYGFATIAFLLAGFIRLQLKETIKNPQKIQFTEILETIPVSIKESINVWRKVPKTAFILFLNQIMMNFSTAIFMPIMILYAVDDLSISETSWSLILTVLFISMIVLSIPSGKLIDKYGKKRPILAAYIIWILIIPLFVYGDFYRLIIAMMFIGLIQVLLGSALSALTADLVNLEHRGKVNGSIGFFSLIGGAIGNILSGYIYDNISHQMPWWLQYTFIIPSIMLIYFYVEESQNSVNS